jgi:adenylosuccinate lyase
LALIASSLEKFATEIRSLQRTEILELEEGFSSNQKGSSAMPHKKNPVICERICGLSRVLWG